MDKSYLYIELNCWGITFIQTPVQSNNQAITYLMWTGVHSHRGVCINVIMCCLMGVGANLLHPYNTSLTISLFWNSWNSQPDSCGDYVVVTGIPLSHTGVRKRLWYLLISSWSINTRNTSTVYAMGANTTVIPTQIYTHSRQNILMVSYRVLKMTIIKSRECQFCYGKTLKIEKYFDIHVSCED